jgi:hypothetical protein
MNTAFRSKYQAVAVLAAIFLSSGFYGTAQASVCCTARPGAGPRVGSFTGAVASPADFLLNPHTDSIESFGMLYGYYANAWSSDGHAGDPLGTGGKLPLIYSLELYREQSVDNPVLTKGDLRTQYVDFGYLPTWRANTVAGIGKFRLTPSLYADAQLVYGGDPGKPGTNTSGQVGVGEVSLTWAPVNFRRFWIKAGNILDAGTFSPVFDQSPIENFFYTGVVASLSADAGNDIRSISSLSFGGTFLNSTILKDESFDMPAGSAGFYHANRQRTFLYARTSLLIRKALGLKFVGGIQALPEDSTRKPVAKAGTDPYLHLRGGVGGMGGIEATLFAGRHFHTLVVSAARGDATIGSFSPDYTLVNSSNNQNVISDPNDFSYDKFAWEYRRAGSTVANVIYWSSVEAGAFRLSGGAWYCARIPARGAMSFVNPMSDSLRSMQPDALMRDSVVTVESQPFHSVKFSLFPSIRIGTTPVFLGIRYDNISYLTPDAYTNAIEPRRDQTLRPFAGDNPESPVYAPSKWDREAVNANIFSPTLRLDFGERGGISAIYSFARYGKPVDRQGRIASFHQNFSLSADVMIMYRKHKKIF